jgi:hypothetical protein
MQADGLGDLLSDAQHGLSEVMGSWKIMEMRLPRTARISRADRPRRSRPSKATSPESMRPGGCTSPRMDSPSTVLPHPDSPTTARSRPGQIEAHAVHGHGRPLGGVEGGAQILYGKEVVGHARDLCGDGARPRSLRVLAHGFKAVAARTSPSTITKELP